MVLKVYGALISPNTKRVLLALEEFEVPYEIQPVDLSTGAHKTPEFLKLQPFGKVPVLEDTELGVTLFESRSILRYLANKYPEKGLGGADAKSKALVDNWLEAESLNLDAFCEGIVVQRVFVPMKGNEPDEAKVAALLAGLEKTLDVLDSHLAKQDYLAGDSFSIADIGATPFLYLTMTAAGEGQVVAKRPNVQAWADRIYGRQGWKNVIARTQLPA